MEPLGDALLPFLAAQRRPSGDARAEVVDCFLADYAIHLSQPMPRRIPWPSAQRRFRLRHLIPAQPQASPRPFFGSGDKLGANGIRLDIATHRQKMFILLNRTAFEPALVERTLSGGVVVDMPTVGVSDMNPLHPGGVISLPGGQDD